MNPCSFIVVINFLKKVAQKCLLVNRMRPNKSSSSASHEKRENASPPLEQPVPETSEKDVTEQLVVMALQQEVIIRDYAYPASSSMHYGHLDSDDQDELYDEDNESTLQRRLSTESLTSTDFPSCHARVILDYSPQTDKELALKKDDIIWIQYRKYPGYFIADVEDDIGLVPESHVELLPQP